MKNPSVIVITGASSGLGEGLAEAYAAPGRTLLLTGRNQARLQGVVSACEAKGARVIPALVDVADRDAMDRMLTDFDRENPIDLLIANAGVGYGTGRYLMERPEHTHELSMINMIGVSNTVMPIINRMAARGQGQIALMASVAGFAAITQSPSYAATKAYVKALGRRALWAAEALWRDGDDDLPRLCQKRYDRRQPLLHAFPDGPRPGYGYHGARHGSRTGTGVLSLAGDLGCRRAGRTAEFHRYPLKPPPHKA